MNQIEIYYFWNNHQKILLDEYFLPSFTSNHKNEFKLIGVQLESSVKEYDFRTPGFRTLMAEKTRKIVDLLKTKKDNDFIIISDIDIYFFENIFEEINKNINLNLDAIFQHEHETFNNKPIVNTGFMLLKGTQKTKDFWNKILNQFESWNNPDDFINEQLFANWFLEDLNFGLFDQKIWCYSHGGFNKNCILHHANVATNLSDKIAQLKEAASLRFKA
jgi:hypothetical protein